MLVRPVVLADIPAIMDLAHHAVTAARWSREQYDRVLADPSRRALVIEESGWVRGFLMARHVASEWEIENLAIAGSARRRGLGTRLLVEFLGQVQAQGALAVFLEVRESNRAARMLYEKWAFAESGRRPGYYHGPEEAAILYRLPLA
ncbi:MAG TPA: ribosomal protein S18-alanine N-acetyltransferase [Terriglobales bacterium]|nr:ribosomal protein S18-alanine N-acetyltransferase [Terriglobales bacterium]